MKFNTQAYEKLYPRQEPVIKDDVPEEDKMVIEPKVEEVKEVVKPTEVLEHGNAGTDEHLTE